MSEQKLYLPLGHFERLTLLHCKHNIPESDENLKIEGAGA